MRKIVPTESSEEQQPYDFAVKDKIVDDIVDSIPIMHHVVRTEWALALQQRVVVTEMITGPLTNSMRAAGIAEDRKVSKLQARHDRVRNRWEVFGRKLIAGFKYAEREIIFIGT